MTILPPGYIGIYECLLPGKLPDYVRYAIVLGGRGSAKSFHTSSAIVSHTAEDDNTILYSRYTMTSANVSIIPEFTEKIDLAGLSEHFETRRDEIFNKSSGGRVLFRGIMQGSKNQTARLKSIPNIKLFALDEGEELVDETSFDVIDLSIRKEGVHSMLWIILNPSDVTHWIYRRFFAKVINRLKPNSVNIIGDTCYIWTTYEINPHLDRAFLDLAERMAVNDPEKYNNIFLGYWRTRKEGLIFPRWQRIAPEEIPVGLQMWYGLDWGYGGDETAIVAVCYEPTTGTLYFRQVAYATGMLLPAIARAIIEDGKAHGLSAGDCLVYCDPARPDNRDQLRVVYGINATNGENKDKAGRIGYLQGFRVKYAGDDIYKEVSTYSWQPSPLDRSTFTDKPQDGGDHCFTGDTLISTPTGQKRIDEIKPGDLVLTSQGPKRVLKTFNNGRKKIRVFSLIFSKFRVEIKATPDHRIKTKNGWKQLQQLQGAETLYLHKSLTENYTADTKGKSISADTISDCTASCGSSITGRFLRAMISTIKTTTRKITRLRIWNLSGGRNTKASTPARMSQRIGPPSLNECPMPGSSQRNGTAPRKAGPGTPNTQKSKRPASPSNWSATAVEKLSARLIPGGSTIFAPRNARQNTAGIPASTMLPASANGAERSSKSIAIPSNDSAAYIVPQSIAAVKSRPGGTAVVYDLCVEDAHEFFANGVLVHNCMDACNYSATHLRRLGVVQL